MRKLVFFAFPMLLSLSEVKAQCMTNADCFKKESGSLCIKGKCGCNSDQDCSSGKCSLDPNGNTCSSPSSLQKTDDSSSNTPEAPRSSSSLAE